MPNYAYNCESCKHKFDEFLSMKDRDNPTKLPCPKCKKKKITRDWGESNNSIGVDTTLTPTKVCGSAWNEVMERVRKTTPMHKKDQLENARTFNAGRYY